jgi:hypothetical protein
MAGASEGIDYAAAYDVLPLAVAVTEGGVEVYRNAKAADLPITGGEAVQELSEGTDALRHKGRWYVRRTTALRGGALVSWEDVDDTVRYLSIHQTLTGKAATMHGVSDGAPREEG